MMRADTGGTTHARRSSWKPFTLPVVRCDGSTHPFASRRIVATDSLKTIFERRALIRLEAWVILVGAIQTELLRQVFSGVNSQFSSV